MSDKIKVQSSRHDKNVKRHTGATEDKTMGLVPEKILGGMKRSPRKTTLERDKLISPQQNRGAKVLSHKKPNSVSLTKPTAKTLIKSTPQMKRQATNKSTTRKERDEKGNKLHNFSYDVNNNWKYRYCSFKKTNKNNRKKNLNRLY